MASKSKGSKAQLEKEKEKEDVIESKWAFEEDMVLPDLVLKHGIKQWDTIAKELSNIFEHVVNYEPRTSSMCEARWKKLLQNGKKRGHWSMQEDQLILQGIQRQKENLGCSVPLPCDRIQWQEIAEAFYGLRTSKQCRERFANHLSPDLKRTPWTTEEDMILIHFQKLFGNSWTKISKEIIGRSENEVKNRWYSVIVKRYSAEALEGMNINMDKLTYGQTSPPPTSSSSSSSTTTIKNQEDNANSGQDSTKMEIANNKEDKSTTEVEPPPPPSTGSKRKRKRPSRLEDYENDEDDTDWNEDDSDEGSCYASKQRRKKNKSEIKVPSPKLNSTKCNPTEVEDVLTSDSEWDEVPELGKLPQQPSTRNNSAKKYQYQYSDDRSGASFSSLYHMQPTQQMSNMPSHMHTTMCHRLPTSELEQVFLKMLEKTEYIVDAGKRILEGDFSRAFILTENKSMEDHEIQGIIELADIYLQNILYPCGDNMMMGTPDEMHDSLFGLTTTLSTHDTNPSFDFPQDHPSSSASSVSTTQHLERYFDAMFDSLKHEDSVAGQYQPASSSYNLPVNSAVDGEHLGNSNSNLSMEHNIAGRVLHHTVQERKVLSLKHPSADELCAASLLSTRFQEPPSAMSVCGNEPSVAALSGDGPVMWKCSATIEVAPQPAAIYSGNTTTLSSSSTPTLTLLNNDWVLSNTTSPIWMEYANCMLQSVPSSPTVYNSISIPPLQST